MAEELGLLETIRPDKVKQEVVEFDETSDSAVSPIIELKLVDN